MGGHKDGTLGNYLGRTVLDAYAERVQENMGETPRPSVLKMLLADLREYMGADLFDVAAMAVIGEEQDEDEEKEEAKRPF